MRGLLIGMSEAVQGRIYQIDLPEVLIGRGSTSTLRVPHRSVSREHCLIRINDDQVVIRDLDSHNGTFVNSLPIHERELVDEDELMVGAVVFVFRILKEGTDLLVNAGTIQPSQSSTLFASSVPLAREAATLARTSEISRLVQALYLSCTPAPYGDSARRLLAAIFEIIPSRRGVLTSFTEGHGERKVLAEYDTDNPAARVLVPDGVVDRLLESRKGAMGIEQQTAWLACPLLVGDCVSGTLYLDSRGTRRDYGSHDCEMICAISDVLALAIENARDLQMLQSENDRLRTEMAPDSALIGKSAVLSSLQTAILKVAKASATVLIRGESGTGKELVARAIHLNGPRKARPFVAVNCAAIAETLLESEFFGHEKGAFTGALGLRKGRFETAEGGTIFLDEIGELGVPLQAKLLRVLQEREFERVGGSRPIKVDVRVIAATNRDLEEAVRSGKFREDLFFRLNVVQLRIPPLRERREDILPLAMHFVRRFSEEIGRSVTGFAREARALLVAYDWPGNVRELQNAVERAIVMGKCDVILPEDLPENLLDGTPAADSPESGFHATVRQYRRRLILAALERSSGNVAEAARELRLHPVSLHRLITSLGLRQS